MIKPTILTFTRYYLPGYRAGGPIRTVNNMVERLSEFFVFRIITSDRDIGDETAYPGLEAAAWQQVGKAMVRYLSPEETTIDVFSDLIRKIGPDVIYLNSFFDPVFTQKVLWARRLKRIDDIATVLAPRGEFSPGALALKYTKKKIFLNLVGVFGIYNGIVWQASTALEKDDIQRTLGKKLCEGAITIAEDLSGVMGDRAHFLERKLTSSDNRSLKVCFLSRITPKKNLDFALKVLAKVRVPITFTIYGPKEVQNYWMACQSLIATMPENVEIQYRGTVSPEEINATLRQHDLFFFPTRGENFGHVIFEALAAGLPVLLSDQTPWNDVDKRDVGWTFALEDIQNFVKVLHECSEWSPENWENTSRRAIDFAREKMNDNGVLEANRRLFAELCV